MRPFDEIPFEESDYSDVALLVASVREWPSEDFARELDARVARRFAPEAAPAAGRAARGGRGRISRWTAGPAVALVAGAVAAVVVLSSGGSSAVVNGARTCTRAMSEPSAHGTGRRARTARRIPPPHYGTAVNTTTPTFTTPTSASGAAGAGTPAASRSSRQPRARARRASRSGGPRRQADPVRPDQPDDAQPARRSGRI